MLYIHNKAKLGPTHLFMAKDGLLRPCTATKQHENSVSVTFVRCGKTKTVYANSLIPYVPYLLDKPHIHPTTQNIAAAQHRNGAIVVNVDDGAPAAPAVAQVAMDLTSSLAGSGQNGGFNGSNGSNLSGSQASSEQNPGVQAQNNGGAASGSHLPGQDQPSEDENSDVPDSSDSSSSDEGSGADSSVSDSDSDSSSSSSSLSSSLDSSEEVQVIPKKKGKKKKRKKSKKSHKVIALSKKMVKKHLKKKNASERLSKSAAKLVKVAIKNNPRWLYYRDVMKAVHGLKDASFWKDFENVDLAKVKFVPIEVLVDLLAARADAVDIGTLRQDLKYFGFFLQKAAVYCDKDVSQVLRMFINLIHSGHSFKYAFQATKPHWVTYRTKQTESPYIIHAKPGKANKGKVFKRCRAFNFFVEGCRRNTCGFSHTCCFCGKGHSLRRCEHDKLPSFAVGGPIRRPPAQPSS